MSEMLVKKKSMETARKSIDRRLNELHKQVDAPTRHSLEMEGKIAKTTKTLQEVVAAINSASVLLSCVEKFMDATHGEDWDGGFRKEAEARGNLLKRRRELMIRAQTECGKLEEDDLRSLAVELWGIARELDVRADDLAAVVSLHLQNQDVGSALDVVEEVDRDGIPVSDEIRGVIGKLVARCVEVAERDGNEVLAMRAKSIAFSPAE